jgi:hypothetical protein
MKRMVVGVVSLVAASVIGAEAQQPSAPNTFPTLAACTEALQSGLLRFYEPRYFGLAARNPVNQRDRVVVPLESDTCLEMLVVGGRRFVAQREGTLFRAQKLADGSLSLYARDDCGNPVYGVVYAPSAAPPPEPSPQLASVPIPPAGPPSPEPRRIRETELPSVPTGKKKGGFCSSTTCRLTLVAVGGAAAGYAVWRYWPCPPGTRHR